MQLPRSQIYLGISLILVLVVLLAAVRAYGAGYRLSFSRGFTTPSALILSKYMPDWQLYIDDKLVIPSTPPEGSTSVQITIPAGSHDIVVMKDRYYPWAKTIEVNGGETLIFSPFHLTIATNGVVLPKSDAEYKTAKDAIAAMTVPTSEAPVVSADGAVEIFIRKTDTELGAELVARVKSGSEIPQSFCNATCTDEKVVTALSAEVRGIAFLPGHNDVILLAVQDGVFAIEVDNRGNHQNFQILYRGIRPNFALSGGVAYIEDNGSIFIVYQSPSN